MPSTARRTNPDRDPTVYPVEEKVGEDLLQRRIVELLRPLIDALLAKRNKKALVGANQFIYWERYNPRKAIAPDIYVLPGVDPDARVTAWKVWDTGIVPSFALEVMAGDETKDVERSPERYAQLGVDELIVFDPDWERRADGVLFRVFRKLKHRGLVLVEATNEDRVRSKALACWLRAVGQGNDVRLRVGLGTRGAALMPTATELAAQQTQRAEQEAQRAEQQTLRAEQEAQRAEQQTLRAEQEALRAEQETDRANQAEREVARLRALLTSREK